MQSLRESLLNRPKNLTGVVREMNGNFIKEFLKQNYKRFNEKYMTIKYIGNETIVDYQDSLIFAGKEQLTDGSFRFGEVKYFDCSMSSGLVNLEGSPEIVKYTFDCSYCKNLISLKGGPKKVGKIFDCGFCGNLKSLEGLPQPLDNRGYQLTCSGCKNIKNLEGCPDRLECILANTCGFESLQGAPREVYGIVNLRSCKNLTTLKGCPKEFTFLLLTHCINLHSLKYVDLKDTPTEMKKIQISKDDMNITDMGDLSEEKIHYV